MFTNNLSIRENIWNHVAVTVDVENSTIKFFLNNSNVFTQSNVSLTINPDIDTNLYIAKSETNSNTFNGLIDSVKLFDSSVSSYQINELSTFKVLDLDMNPTEKNLIIDNSSFNNSVTLSNDPSITNVYQGYQPGNKSLMFDSTKKQSVKVSSDSIKDVNAKQMSLSMWVKPNIDSNVMESIPIITKNDLFKLN